MSIEETLDRLATNVAMIAGAISTLAEAVNGTYKGNPIYKDHSGEPSVPPAALKTRGRPARGETDGKAVAPEKTTAAEPAGAAIDPTPATKVSPPAQVGTKDAMKAAVLAYRDVTDQDTALTLLTAVGAENWGTVPPHLYQQVTDSAVAALAALQKPPVKEVDPFDDDDIGGSVALPVVALADVKKAFVARQKDVSESALLGVLKTLGAVGAGAPGDPPAPSLKHLAADKFAAAIEAVQKLPKTK